MAHVDHGQRGRAKAGQHARSRLSGGLCALKLHGPAGEVVVLDVDDDKDVGHVALRKRESRPFLVPRPRSLAEIVRAANDRPAPAQALPFSILILTFKFNTLYERPLPLSHLVLLAAQPCAWARRGKPPPTRCAT
ncbi:MAG: hypothetical protein Q8S17_00925, partial [Humidesulfovibrio sp.]|nr:hypothetical protein [Humidesulfovibrio sp.]